MSPYSWVKWCNIYLKLSPMELPLLHMPLHAQNLSLILYSNEYNNTCMGLWSLHVVFVCKLWHGLWTITMNSDMVWLENVINMLTETLWSHRMPYLVHTLWEVSLRLTFNGVILICQQPDTHGWGLTWLRLGPNSFLGKRCSSGNLVLYWTVLHVCSARWINEWRSDLPNYLVFTFYFFRLDFRVCPSLQTVNWGPMPKQGQWLMKSSHLFQQWLLMVVRKKRLKG